MGRYKRLPLMGGIIMMYRYFVKWDSKRHKAIVSVRQELHDIIVAQGNHDSIEEAIMWIENDIKRWEN